VARQINNAAAERLSHVTSREWAVAGQTGRHQGSYLVLATTRPNSCLYSAVLSVHTGIRAGWSNESFTPKKRLCNIFGHMSLSQRGIHEKLKAVLCILALLGLAILAALCLFCGIFVRHQYGLTPGVHTSSIPVRQAPGNSSARWVNGALFFNSE